MASRSRNSPDKYTDRKTVYGDHLGSATLQYCRLETIKIDAVKFSLETRAQELAKSFYTTLLPLSHRMTDSPNNIKAKHLELLEKITCQCVRLAAELQARQGTFTILWPEFNTPFDPVLYNVDESQADDVRNMDDATREKQLIAFTLLPVVQRLIQNEERPLTYARGVVLLKEPYVGYRRS
jgi:hypothetical protein